MATTSTSIHNVRDVIVEISEISSCKVVELTIVYESHGTDANDNLVIANVQTDIKLFVDYDDVDAVIKALKNHKKR